MRGRRKKVIAIVKSNKMDKTVVCETTRLVLHPKYKKYIRKKTKLYAHDPNNECQVGDKVLLMETRPLSKLKRWRVVKKL
ncbi:MAG: 30S ribosomal protein S17 [candidate division WOR-3 bacterium]